MHTSAAAGHKLSLLHRLVAQTQSICPVYCWWVGPVGFDFTTTNSAAVNVLTRAQEFLKGTGPRVELLGHRASMCSTRCCQSGWATLHAHQQQSVSSRCLLSMAGNIQQLTSRQRLAVKWDLTIVCTGISWLLTRLALPPDVYVLFLFSYPWNACF